MNAPSRAHLLDMSESLPVVLSKDFQQAFKTVNQNLVVRSSILVVDPNTTLDLSAMPTLPGVPDGEGDLSAVEWVPEGGWEDEGPSPFMLEAKDVRAGDDLTCVCHGLVVPIHYGEVLRCIAVPEPEPTGKPKFRRGKVSTASVYPQLSKEIVSSGVITVERDARPGRPAEQFTVPASYFVPAREFQPGEQLRGVDLALAALP